MGRQGTGRAEGDFEGAEGAPPSYGSREPLETTCQHDSSAKLRIVIEASSIGRVALGEPTAAPMWTQRLVAFKLSTGRLFQAAVAGGPPFRLLAPPHPTPDEHSCRHEPFRNFVKWEWGIEKHLSNGMAASKDKKGQGAGRRFLLRAAAGFVSLFAFASKLNRRQHLREVLIVLLADGPFRPDAIIMPPS